MGCTGGSATSSSRSYCLGCSPGRPYPFGSKVRAFLDPVLRGVVGFGRYGLIGILLIWLNSLVRNKQIKVLCDELTILVVIFVSN